MTDDLENRMRYLESEVEGEKLLTRHTLDQCRRISAEVGAARVEIGAIGLRLDNVASDVVELRAASRNHGTLIGMLQRDVAALRNDATELRRGQEAVNAQLDDLRHGFGRLETSVAGLETSVARLETSVAAILAAVTPRGPA